MGTGIQRKPSNVDFVIAVKGKEEIEPEANDTWNSLTMLISVPNYAKDNIASEVRRKLMDLDFYL